MTVETISMLGSIPSARVRLIDQTLLPTQEIFLLRDNYKDLAADIQRLAVRGAPAIGVAGAFAIVLAMQDKGNFPLRKFQERVESRRRLYLSHSADCGQPFLGRWKE